MLQWGEVMQKVIKVNLSPYQDFADLLQNGKPDFSMVDGTSINSLQDISPKFQTRVHNSAHLARGKFRGWSINDQWSFRAACLFTAWIVPNIKQ
ncbi:hypothetical protein RG47T_4196 [Mucilaginibacter polytrichastri]|uniref:Uncharacterized protein n=1 Tax=Mucilaginibacter polytrichastri TaxID=1302689 RepID=A0A1Q6A3Y6_9SPHI|nr:hypothetical protein RG47T_4196 [Mucilaginibacter polytrichastri]